MAACMILCRVLGHVGETGGTLHCRPSGGHVLRCGWYNQHCNVPTAPCDWCTSKVFRARSFLSGHCLCVCQKEWEVPRNRSRSSNVPWWLVGAHGWGAALYFYRGDGNFLSVRFFKTLLLHVAAGCGQEGARGQVRWCFGTSIIVTCIRVFRSAFEAKYTTTISKGTAAGRVTYVWCCLFKVLHTLRGYSSGR